jgi:phage terminase large subunit-like protein
LLLCPTTAGYDQLSIGYALRTTLTKILEGTFEADHLLGVIYTLDEGDDWRDEAVWIKANPMLGVTPGWDNLRRYCLDAQQTPGLEGEFKVKCCSLWSNAAAAWLSMAVWDACADPTLTLEQFAGDRCWMGIDLAERDDLAAVAFVFVRADQLVGFVRCYLPKDVVQERARAIPEYRVWADQGVLTMTDGARTDPDVIAEDLRRWCQQFRVQALVFDDYDPPQLIDRLSAEGLPAVKERKTARTMTLPARELETRLAARRFRHDGNTCLKWQASNVVVQTFADGSILPRKESHSSPYKVDAIDALLQAIGSYVRMQSAIPNYAVRVVG